jgi:hypothetical protein
VDDERVTAVETEELVLPSSLDRLDSLSPGSARPRGRKFAAESRMNGPHSDYRFAKRGAGKCAGGALDLW